MFKTSKNSFVDLQLNIDDIRINKKKTFVLDNNENYYFILLEFLGIYSRVSVKSVLMKITFIVDFVFV